LLSKLGISFRRLDWPAGAPQLAANRVVRIARLCHKNSERIWILEQSLEASNVNNLGVHAGEGHVAARPFDLGGNYCRQTEIDFFPLMNLHLNFALLFGGQCGPVPGGFAMFNAPHFVELVAV